MRIVLADVVRGESFEADIFRTGINASAQPPLLASSCNMFRFHQAGTIMDIIFFICDRYNLVWVWLQ